MHGGDLIGKVRVVGAESLVLGVGVVQILTKHIVLRNEL